MAVEPIATNQDSTNQAAPDDGLEPCPECGMALPAPVLDAIDRLYGPAPSAEAFIGELRSGLERALAESRTRHPDVPEASPDRAVLDDVAARDAVTQWIGQAWHLAAAVRHYGRLGSEVRWCDRVQDARAVSEAVS